MFILRSIWQLLIFITVGALWWAILWFGIGPAFREWSPSALIAIHILPPVTAWLAWWMGHKLIKRRRAQAREASEKQTQAERQATLDAARKRHEQEMQHRRFACDCRLVAISDLAAHGKLELPEVPNVWAQTVAASAKATAIAGTDILDALEPAITQALRHVYERCGAAAVFPLYILPPAGISSDEVIKSVRAINRQLVEEMALQVKPKTGIPSITFLPLGDSASNSVIAVFENTPDLPGAVVLAFDSPLSQAVPQASMAFDDTELEREKQNGKPSHGVFALLLTPADLPSMLNAVADRHDDEEEDDIFDPFRQKAQQPKGNLALLTMVSASLREELAKLPTMARIHRAAFERKDSTQSRSRVQELSRTVMRLLEGAQINAGLIELPFTSGEAIDQPADKKEEAEKDDPRCGWLVHNAGPSEYAIDRLPAIGMAMMYFKIDLNPVDMATNMVTDVGNLGRAAPIGMLALALTQTQQVPAMYVEFSEQNGIAVAFTIPVKTDDAALRDHAKTA